MCGDVVRPEVPRLWPGTWIHKALQLKLRGHLSMPPPSRFPLPSFLLHGTHCIPFDVVMTSSFA